MPTPDIELGPKNVTSKRGFALVASKINSDVDKTTTIYRRFDELSARNLLFYQAELAELEEELKENDEEDSQARDEVAVDCQRDWSVFERSAGEGVVREKRRMELVMKVREKLGKYHTALAAHQTLLNAQPPSPSTVKALRAWFFDNTNTSASRQIPRLWGASERMYDNVHDLVALRVPADQDRLSSFIQNNFSLLFQTSSPDGATTYISERSVSHFVAIFSTVLAAIMLFGAIISLYIVKNPHALLGMLSGWTVLFAACVGLLTNARRDQIFGATAAYAAVLVVFITIPRTLNELHLPPQASQTAQASRARIPLHRALCPTPKLNRLRRNSGGRDRGGTFEIRRE
ncbi:hypothetical protein LARI1_G002861 [Lachnellula arida]|uniref:DUF6594 domain-containing protein n=1 Tax=Lachnellula arida TaxID=1316785 RepID=A0A8T9BF59_9HELO|nr:hypothetical protein LARI1_G002861 [Lachnellula arida]